MILVIDNYDSFVYNIARYFERAGEECRVERNDEWGIAATQRLNPTAIIISPGPCTPKEAGVSTEIIQTFGSRIPILGICLGHQCIGEAYGGKTVRTSPMHGKASMIAHTGDGLFENIPNPFRAGRYHSLITELPEQTPLIVNARTEDGTIMAMQHQRHQVYGVQFHPESVLTEHGDTLIENFLRIAKQFRTLRLVA